MQNMIKLFLFILALSFEALLSSGFVYCESLDNQTLSVRAEKAPDRLLTDIKLVKNDRLIAVGERGHIILSDDLGESWHQVLVPTDTLLTRLFFVDDSTGWAVGHRQVILKTIDAGNSWELQHVSDLLDKPALFDVWFKDPMQGIAVGSYGLYLSTYDGGATWEEIHQSELEDPEVGFAHFYSMAFEKKSGRLFIAGELGFLAISDDLGQTWMRLESPYTGSFFNVEALPNGYVLLMGLRGHLFRSKDLGDSWEEINTGTTSVLQNSMLWPVSQKLLILGADGTQLMSSDYGQSVKLIQRSDRSHLSAAVALPSSEVILVGVNGVIKASLN